MELIVTVLRGCGAVNLGGLLLLMKHVRCRLASQGVRIVSETDWNIIL